MLAISFLYLNIKGIKYRNILNSGISIFDQYNPK
jgi:hypothetical protein